MSLTTHTCTNVPSNYLHMYIMLQLIWLAMFLVNVRKFHLHHYIIVDGAPGGIPDRIFISAGTQVKAHTKKGKQFLKFESNLTEPIRSM